MCVGLRDSPPSCELGRSRRRGGPARARYAAVATPSKMARVVAVEQHQLRWAFAPIVRPRSVTQTSPDVSVMVWSMIGLAFWHFTVLLPDRFAGGIIGALLAACGGALVSGFLLPSPGIPSDNPPGIAQGVWGSPGAVLALGASWFWGSRTERAKGR